MASAAQSPSEQNRPPLTPTESIALECLKQIASEGRRVTNAEICAAIGSDNHEGGTGPAVISRLEQKGYITRNQFQRGCQVCIVDSGICTIPPQNTAPHWRKRTERVPTPTIRQISETTRIIATQIEIESRAVGKHYSDFLADLVYIGWHQYQAEKEGV